ncbi:MAG: hypothetical protein GC150_14895 [Rhizobiales bacterium]|nr:hypothetical protein [Hyphomicrobiales bacterium]
MDERMGGNIQGPSLIRVPDWVRDPLGRYYLYFAHHKGSYIRLAFADALEGPWSIHRPGVLELSDSGFLTDAAIPPADPAVHSDVQQWEGIAPPGTPGVPDPIDDATLPHIASPDVHVDHAAGCIRMYYHGLESYGRQVTRVALSHDGLTFKARPDVLGPSYFRVFRHGGFHYALVMPGIIFRSADGLGGFERGPDLFDEPLQRHAALLHRGDRLHVFWTKVGDAPERILCSTVDLAGDWHDWRATGPHEVLRPAMEWEGARLPRAPSFRGAMMDDANQLRDPAIFEEDGRIWLLYSVRGEAGIAIAALEERA